MSHVLRYGCGSARQFVKADGSHVETQDILCNWNRSWTPSHKILVISVGHEFQRNRMIFNKGELILERFFLIDIL